MPYSQGRGVVGHVVSQYQAIQTELIAGLAAAWNQFGDLAFCLVERAPLTRQTRVIHEVVMGTKWCGTSLVSGELAIRTKGPALQVIVYICDHDLIQDLLMNRMVLNWDERLDTVDEVSGHPISR